jgi:signal transduction histidine kinase
MNGEVADMQLRAHSIAFADAEAKLVLANDVTARNRAQRALAEANRQLLVASRQAGMAEVATGVLHNVGNVLNSVNVSASLLAQGIRESRSRGIDKAANLLEANRENLAEFFADGGKGTLLANYLRSLATELAGEREAQLAELTSLGKNIDHIKEIVAMQQSHAKVGGLAEKHSTAELIDEAVKLAAADCGADQQRVHVDFGARTGWVFTDRHKALQILVNLISNARQAMADLPLAERILTICTERAGENEIAIRVSDRGCGIPVENLTRIFAYGFTTRAEGHGFGLHAAALAAKEVGGSISVHSDGAGCGATFTVKFPAGTFASSTDTERQANA